jgi:hypothetical protein
MIVRARDAMRLLLAGASALALTACAGAPTRGVTSSEVKARPAARVDWVGGWDSAVATAIAGMERELGLPIQVSVYLYPGRRAFEEALVQSGYRPEFARETAGTMTAIGGYRAVLINEANLASTSWERRLALLAHELTHTLQYDLGGGERGTSDQWLREGFAEWVSVRVLEHLQTTSVTEARHRALLALRARRREPLPGLEAMVTFPQWVSLGQGVHAGVMYDHAFAAVDFLIQRHGLSRAVRYFELFAGSGDRVANFRAAFGEELSAFEQAFRAALR